jgi:membrane protease YdiL (CAAX protease family)
LPANDARGEGGRGHDVMVAAPMAAAIFRRHLRPALLLGGAGTLATACVFPYVLELRPELLAQLRALPVPLALIATAQLAQAFVLLSSLAWTGLALGEGLGLDAQLLRERAQRGDAPFPWRTLGIACAWGVGVGVVLVLLDLVFKPLLPPPLSPLPENIAPWKGFLASFYGGIAEEVQTRLFFMTLVAWVLWRMSGRSGKPWIYRVAILVAALAFGAAHLPAAIMIWGFGMANVARTVVLNGLAGIVFGSLYWRRGIEHAMAAHFSADMVLHVLAPL